MKGVVFYFPVITGDCLRRVVRITGGMNCNTRLLEVRNCLCDNVGVPPDFIVKHTDTV